MLDLTTEQVDALVQRRVKRRIFIYCDAVDLDGEPDPAGFWDDVGTVELDGKTYHGSGSVVTLSSLSARADMTIPGLTLTLSGVDVASIDLVRAHALAQAPISVSIGLYDVSTGQVLLPLIRRFVGVIDDILVNTPAVGERGSIIFTCESSSRALTIKRTETRSPASMSQRAPGDLFYKYTASQKEQTIYFGRKGP